MRPSSNAWVSESIQWRSSTISSRGWTWLSRRSKRLTASRVCRRRCGGSRVSQALSSTGTSSNARSGVRRDSSERSSVSSLPATRSRMARGSSRSWIRQYALSSSMTARYGVALPYETNPLSSTSHPCVRCDRENSQTRRDLPKPASPTTATACPCPAAARSSACASCCSSRSRPTKRVRPACGARLKAGASRDAAGQLVDRGGSLEPLHGHRAERLHLDMAFGQPQGVAGDQSGPGLGHLLHPGGEVGGLPDRGVVHVQVVANSTDDDLAGIESHANL